jgi:hypothetical protein
MLTPTKRNRTVYVVCLKNDGYPASLEVRKLYKSMPDPVARKQGLLRVVDESGEDYLFPANWFAKVSVAPTVRRALAAV